MTADEKKTVLLTGASGVIGRAVAEELRDHHVIGFAHADSDIPEVDETVTADLSRPRFGLPEDRWHELAERVDVIVHSGALTAWGQPRAHYQEINIDGTRRVVELAKRAQAPVHQISTCFVHAIERDALDRLGPTNVVAPYIWSKLEAERLLAESGVPYSISRPTNLVGDSRTGASSRPQIVQLMSDWYCRGKAPYFPAHPGNLVDVVSLDVTAIAVARAVETGLTGGPIWITSGAQAMTVEEAQDILREHARTQGREIDRVPVVDPSGPLPVPLQDVPPMSRTFLKVLIDVSEVTSACGGVLPSSLPELRDRLGVPAANDRDAFRLSLKYWAEQRATSSTEPGAEPEPNQGTEQDAEEES
jgi:nucleoside-diphosphate-sugar epimerase